jgi:VanZ family protein
MLKLIKNWLLDNAKQLAILVSLVIVLLSLIKSDSLPVPKLNVSDKLLHAFAYSGLIWSWLLAFRKKLTVKNKLFIFVLLFLLGVLLEFLQGILTQYRTPDIKDALANFIGLVVGLITFKPLASLVFGKLLYQ